MNTDKKISRSILQPALCTGLLLMIPLIAMKFTSEVNWDITDFTVAGTLLFGTGLAYTLTTRKSSDIAYRFAVGFALFSVLFLIWTNLAVGIIGSENNPANKMYFLVPVVGIISVIIAKFRHQGMEWAMIAMVLAMAVIIVIALSTGMHTYPRSSMFKVIAVNGFFMVLFTISALLFRYTSRTQPAENAEPKV
ncbi:hypothetical protein BH23BAC3_BH23BAC3_02280 [soil metagenome]